MKGLRKLLTHRALASGDEDADQSHRHIAAAFDFFNGYSWISSAADDGGGVAHFCECCQSDSDAAATGASVRQAILNDAITHDFVPSRWQKKVTPAQLWCTLFLCGNGLSDIASRCSGSYRRPKDDVGDAMMEFLDRKKKKFANFCRDPSTPFLMGVKVFNLVSLEPLVLCSFGAHDHDEQPESEQPGPPQEAVHAVVAAEAAEVAGPASKKPPLGKAVADLQRAYAAFMLQARVSMEDDPSASWQTGAQPPPLPPLRCSTVATPSLYYRRCY